jgi:hypothetical protein
LRSHDWRPITPKLKGGKETADDDAELDDYELPAELFLDAVQRCAALVRAGDNGAIPARDDREYPDYYLVRVYTLPYMLAEAIKDTDWGTLEAGREVIDSVYYSRSFTLTDNKHGVRMVVPR